MANRVCTIAATLLMLNTLMLDCSTASDSPVLLRPSPAARSLLRTGAGTSKVIMMHPDDCALLLEWPNVSRALGVTACNGSVACDFCSKDGRIESLGWESLGFGDIHGTLPASWSSMKGLRRIFLYFRGISGPLPPSWGDMNVSYLLLTNTQVSGTIPSSWGNMNLTSLGLSNTNISGPLPPSLGGVPLTELDLSNTNISGSIPESWARLANLSYLKLSNTNINGTIPGSWGGMARFAKLDLSNTNISGPLPASWRRNTFNHLDLSNTKIHGRISTSWIEFSMHLDLSNTGITGPLPQNSWRAQSMQYMNISNTNISGSVAEGWIGMSRMAVMDLSRSKVTGTLPAHWGGSMAGLITLNLSSTNFSGTLPASWSGMQNLYTLDLSKTKVSGPLPQHWHSMKDLLDLDISNTRVSGSLPESWSRMESLTSLDLSNTLISGSLPESWGRMESLTSLNLSSTNISGSVPGIWAGMAYLYNLNLSNTNISGSIPERQDSLANLSSYVRDGANFRSWYPKKVAYQWDLSNTLISGKLPETFDGMTTLVSLDLHNTLVDGTLPSSWSTMPGLVSLDLSNTSLHGSIPDSWTQKDSMVMKHLRYMSVPFSKSTVTPELIDRVCSANTFLKLRTKDKEWDFSGICSSNLRARRKIATAILAAFAALLLACLVYRCCCGKKGHTCSILHLWQRKFSCCSGFRSSGKPDQQKTSCLHSSKFRSCCSCCYSFSCCQHLGHFLKRCPSLLLSGTWLHMAAIFADIASDVWVVYQVAPRTWLDVTVNDESNELTPHFRLFLCLVVFLFVPDLVASSAAYLCWFAVGTADSGLLPATKRAATALLCLLVALPLFSVFLHIILFWALVRHLFSSCTPSNTTSGPKQPGSANHLILDVIHPVRYKELVGLLMACTEDVASIAITTVFFVVNRNKYGKTLRTPAYVINVVLSMAHVLWETWVWAPRLREHGFAAIGRAFCFQDPSGHVTNASASAAAAAQQDVEMPHPTPQPVPDSTRPPGE